MSDQSRMTELQKITSNAGGSLTEKLREVRELVESGKGRDAIELLNTAIVQAELTVREAHKLDDRAHPAFGR